MYNIKLYKSSYQEPNFLYTNLDKLIVSPVYIS